MKIAQSLFGRQLVLVAVLGDRDAPHEVHHEVGPAGLGRPGVEDLGDVRVVHQGQRLPLGLEAGDHLLGVHAQLDDLQRHLAADRLLLLGHVDDAQAALADLLQQLVGADHRARFFRDGWTKGSLQARSGRFQKTPGFGFAVDPEKAPHVLPQLDIPAAGFGDVALPLLRRQVADSVDEYSAGLFQVCGHGRSLHFRHITVRIWVPDCPEENRKKSNPKAQSLCVHQHPETDPGVGPVFVGG